MGSRGWEGERVEGVEVAGWEKEFKRTGTSAAGLLPVELVDHSKCLVVFGARHKDLKTCPARIVLREISSKDGGCRFRS